MYDEFRDVSMVCTIESGKALVGRAFASHGSCFCKDVTLLSINDYPLVPSARKAGFTRSFSICLQSKCANNIIFIVEYFLPPNEMVLSDTKTFLNMLLSTMQQQLPGFVVASGKELGQRMPVEVVKVSPTNEFDSFEIGQPLPSLQSLQDGGETTEIDSSCQQPNLQINSAGNATTNNEKIHSHKNNSIQRIEKDHGITREILEQHFGMTLKDAAENLQVSRATLKRISREYNISRWPHHKTRKVNVHVSQGVSFQGADQQCPALSQREKVTDSLDHKRSPASRVPSDSLMTLKVTYRGDIIKFQLSLSSTRVELEGEVEKRLKIPLERFSIKYEDEDNDWILITSDSDLRDGMHSLMALGRTTMRLLVTPKADT